MSLRNVLALGLSVWVSLGTVAHASPTSWTGAWWNRTFASNPYSFSAPHEGPTGSGDPAVLNQGGGAPANFVPFQPTPTPDPTVSTSTSTAAPTPSSSSTSTTPDAFINFGNGPYLEASALTTGTIQPWYDSPAVEKVFGGVPNAQQQTDFTQAVLNDVETTYKLSGLNKTFTLDPNTGAAHTLSVVSGASYGPNANVIGITDVGHNGFSFIDKLSAATTPDQLEWAVAHNVSHELMHAFGVAVHEDQTGQYLDSAVASWPLLTNPNTVFSAAAVRDVIAGKAVSSGATGAEVLTLQPVPEPTTLAVWGLGTLAAAYRWRRSRRAAA